MSTNKAAPAKKSPISNPKLAAKTGKLGTKGAKAKSAVASSRLVSEIIWWEKTVEYMFAIEQAERGARFAPLDGYHEAAGDLITIQNKKWLLIEFKANVAGKGSEAKKISATKLKKFKAWRDRDFTKDFGPLATFHFFVYGHKDDSGLLLRAEKYIEQDGVIEDVNGLYSRGVSDGKAFDKYVLEFAKHKKKKKRPPNSGGGNGGEANPPKGPNDDPDYSLVAVFGKVDDKDVWACVPMSDYVDIRRRTDGNKGAGGSNGGGSDGGNSPNKGSGGSNGADPSDYKITKRIHTPAGKTLKESIAPSMLSTFKTNEKEVLSETNRSVKRKAIPQIAD